MRFSVVFAFASLSLVLAAACGADASTCASGTACVSCNDNQSCTRSCSGADCSFTCNGNGSCRFECPQGGCTAINNGNGSLELDCAGGGCTVECDGNGSCAIADCPTCACHQGLLGGSCAHL